MSLVLPWQPPADNNVCFCLVKEYYLYICWKIKLLLLLRLSSTHWSCHIFNMMKSSNKNIFGEFPTQRPVTWCFDVFFSLRLNKWSNKQSWGWWFETPSHSLWRHRDEIHPELREIQQVKFLMELYYIHWIMRTHSNTSSGLSLLVIAFSTCLPLVQHHLYIYRLSAFVEDIGLDRIFLIQLNSMIYFPPSDGLICIRHSCCLQTGLSDRSWWRTLNGPPQLTLIKL